MSNNIGDFLARVQQQGIIKPNKYQIMFAGHGFDDACAATGFSVADANRILSDACEEVNFPGSTIATKAFRVYGLPREMPYERLYSQQLDMTFRLDENMRIKALFDEWMKSIVDPETLDVKYYDEFICDAKIQVFADRSDTSPVYEGLVVETFPKSIDAIQLGYDQQNTYMKQKVGFTFRRIDEGFFI